LRVRSRKIKNKRQEEGVEERDEVGEEEGEE
jgi:hypothetical protein